jgi:hypothetical protein
VRRTEVLKKNLPVSRVRPTTKLSTNDSAYSARRVSNAEVRCARLRVSPATAVTPRFQSVGDTTERTEGRCAGLDSKKKRVVSDDCKTK